MQGNEQVIEQLNEALRARILFLDGTPAPGIGANVEQQLENDFLESQLSVIKNIGFETYLSRQINADKEPA